MISNDDASLEISEGTPSSISHESIVSDNVIQKNKQRITLDELIENE